MNLDAPLPKRSIIRISKLDFWIYNLTCAKENVYQQGFANLFQTFKFTGTHQPKNAPKIFTCQPIFLTFFLKMFKYFVICGAMLFIATDVKQALSTVWLQNPFVLLTYVNSSCWAYSREINGIWSGARLLASSRAWSQFSKSRRICKETSACRFVLHQVNSAFT